MQNDETGKWLAIAWEAVKGLLGVTSVVFLWFARGYAAQRSAVKTLKDDVAGLEEEVGRQQAFRKLCDGAPIGEKLIAALKEIDEEHETLHGRINDRKEELNEFKNQVAGKLGRIEGYLEILVGEHKKKDERD